MDCPAESLLAEFVEGLLQPARVLEIEQHLDLCSDCCEVVSQLAKTEIDGSENPAAIEPAALVEPPARLLADTLDALLSRGAIIGRYLVVDVIGLGGMGVVYAAYDPELDRKVALKLLRGTGNSSVEARARLVREAQALGRLNHPHVVSIYDVGAFGDQVFIAMEFVRGRSLRQWLGEQRLPARKILDVFREAGRGLSAAHEAGLVHRDFKPDNVMIGDDGRVRVMDFGLARAEGSPATDDPAPIRSGRVDITLEGTQPGTPAYMAPEQRAGRPTDARADQFSFCVSLHEALLGERPASDENERMLRIRRARGISHRVREALSRGLRAAPEERYPSMAALLDTLEAARLTSRPGRYLVAAVLAAGFFAGWSHYRSSAQLCRGAERHLENVWDDGRKRAAKAAFSAISKSFSADAWRGTEAALDEYTRNWAAMHTEACEATRIRGEQSDRLLSLRMECLDRRLREISALTDLLIHADATVVEKAVTSAGSLVPLQACSDRAALEASVRPAEDPNLRRKVEMLRETLARAEALERTGKWAEGLTLSQKVAEQARELGYRPLFAEALFRRGMLERQTGKIREAEQTLYQAVSAAEGSHHDELAAEVWSEILAVAGDDIRDLTRGRLAEERALAALDRIGGEGPLRIRLLENVGSFRRAQGLFAEAVSKSREALELAKQLLGPDHPRVAEVSSDLATGLRDQGRLDEALRAYEFSLAIREKTLGSMHPEVADTLTSLAVACARSSNYERARSLNERALQIREQALGPNHIKVAESLNNLSLVLGWQGEPEEALPLAERALAIEERTFGEESPNVASVLNNLGFILEYLGANERARLSYERSRAIREKTLGPNHTLVALTLGNLGHLALSQERNAEALHYYRRALSIDESAIGASHPDLAFALTGVGRSYIVLGDAHRALDPLERALVLRERNQVSPDKLADTRFALARALWQSGGDRRRARALALQAQEGYLAAGKRTDHDRAHLEEWLRAHRAESKAD